MRIKSHSDNKKRAVRSALPRRNTPIPATRVPDSTPLGAYGTISRTPRSTGSGSSSAASSNSSPSTAPVPKRDGGEREKAHGGDDGERDQRAGDDRIESDDQRGADGDRGQQSGRSQPRQRVVPQVARAGDLQDEHRPVADTRRGGGAGHPVDGDQGVVQTGVDGGRPPVATMSGERSPLAWLIPYSGRASANPSAPGNSSVSGSSRTTNSWP